MIHLCYSYHMVKKMSKGEILQEEGSNKKDQSFQVLRLPPDEAEWLAKEVGWQMMQNGKDVSKQDILRVAFARAAGVPPPEVTDFKIDPANGPKSGDSTFLVVAKLPSYLNVAIKNKAEEARSVDPKTGKKGRRVSINQLVRDELTKMRIESARRDREVCPCCGQKRSS